MTKRTRQVELMSIYRDFGNAFFELKKGDKTPLKKGWCKPENRFDIDTAENVLLRGGNVGCCPPEGWLIIDVDSRNGGNESYLRLIHDTGLPDLVEMGYPTVETGGGGFHIYMRAKPEDVARLVNNRNYYGIDIKTHTGYVVTPGSIHPNGKCYSVFNQGTFYDAPKEILSIFKRAERKPIESSRNKTTISHEDLERILNTKQATSFSSNTSWFPIMCAAHDTTGGTDEALNVFTEWSIADPDYRESANEIKTRWDSLHNKPGNITAGTLAHYFDKEIVIQILLAAGFDDLAAHGIRPLTDLGNAERLVDAHGADLAYTTSRGWLFYDGARWCRDEGDLRVREVAAYTVREIWKEIDRVEDSKQKGALAKHARASERADRIEAMVKLARPMLRIAAGAFDSDPFAFNVLNGTIDLRMGAIRPHNHDDKIAKLAPVTYDPGAACPRWLQFLREVFGDNAELIAFVQRAVGYSLTGDTREQCFFLLYGTGANGKSTLVDALRALLGDYCATAAFESFTASNRTGGGARGDLARLVGTRLVSASEGEAGQTLAESVVKQLTGGETIAVRHLYCEEFEFVPTFKIWLSTNHEPQIRGTDEAIWRRVVEIPFNATFPEGQRDPQLGEKLEAEIPGILNWAIEGCLAWRREGLNKPSVVREAVAEYRETQDALGDFIRECVVIADGHNVRTGEMYCVYESFCRGRSEQPWKSKTFNKAMRDRGYVFKKRADANYWLGVRVTDPRAEDFESGDESQSSNVKRLCALTKG